MKGRRENNLHEKETHRLEMFSDGVFAIAITLLILEIKVPPVHSIHSIPEFWQQTIGKWASWFAFGLSFWIILVVWILHHNALKLITKSSQPFFYANGFLLLTVVTLPYITGVMAEFLGTHFAQPAITLYCFGVFIHTFAWIIFHRTVMHPVRLTKDEISFRAYKRFVIKANRIVLIIYPSLCILSFWFPYTSMILLTLSLLIWIFMALRITRKNKL